MEPGEIHGQGRSGRRLEGGRSHSGRQFPGTDRKHCLRQGNRNAAARAHRGSLAGKRAEQHGNARERLRQLPRGRVPAGNCPGGALQRPHPLCDAPQKRSLRAPCHLRRPLEREHPGKCTRFRRRRLVLRQEPDRGAGSTCGRDRQCLGRVQDRGLAPARDRGRVSRLRPVAGSLQEDFHGHEPPYHHVLWPVGTHPQLHLQGCPLVSGRK